MRNKFDVFERGSDMVLANQFTPAGGLTTTTMETVRFERPDLETVGERTCDMRRADGVSAEARDSIAT